jgi:hypothetical protein
MELLTVSWKHILIFRAVWFTSRNSYLSYDHKTCAEAIVHVLWTAYSPHWLLARTCYSLDVALMVRDEPAGVKRKTHDKN